jgi:prophage regulatory protein
MADKFVRLGQVMEMTGLSRSSIYAYMAAGTFPAAVNIGQRSVAWIEQDLVEWIAGRIAAHRQSSQSKAAVSRAE